MQKNYNNFDRDSDIEHTRFDADAPTFQPLNLKNHHLLFPNSHKKCCPNGVSTHSFIVHVGLLTPFALPPTGTPINGRVKVVITDSPDRNKTKGKENDKGKGKKRISDTISTDNKEKEVAARRSKSGSRANTPN